MKGILENPDPYLAALVDMLDADELTDISNLIRRAEVSIEETGYDNWNGGTKIFTIFLHIPSAEYAKLASRREQYQEQMNVRLKSIVESYGSDWFTVAISPKVVEVPDWRKSSGILARETRKKIIDELILTEVNWSGSLNDVEFLSRLYDLTVLPSTDSRYSDAARDIWQHRVNNPEDWPDNWIFSDKRFKLLDGSEEQFLKFLCEMVHPVVRPDRNEALRLARQFNEKLRADGWILDENELILGRPLYEARKLSLGKTRISSRANTVAEALDAGWMKKEIERMELAVEIDPALAIGTAKELVETCCKSILAKRNVEFSPSADLPALTKILTKELNLVPDGISDKAKGADVIRLILRNLTALTQYISELRGLYGTGHGRDGNYKGLAPRHARLAVGAAVTFIDFVTETHHDRQ